MTISQQDLQLGQLALARGLIDLSSLLRCVLLASEEKRDLRQVLKRTGGLDRERLDELATALAAMSVADLKEAVDLGETIVVRSLHERSVKSTQSLVSALIDPIETTITLDMPPETGANPSLKRPALSGEGSAEKRYDFLDELGRGGMGQILRAQDRILDREIALKTLLPNTNVDAPQLRLIAEARLTGRLEHPSIVPVYDLGYLSSGEPYYTMRVITERNLQTVIEEMREDKPGAPSLLHLVQILRQVCLAIQYAHDRGVIHRDLKPENILIGDYGEVFVIDWGIAKILSHVLDLPDPTESAVRKGGLLGTPLYMAPEQAHGNNDAVDERTDVYALGAMLYEIMTLTPVFEISSVLGLLMAIIQEEPEAPSMRAPERNLPRALEEICLRAISKAPENRYQSAQELANELELFLEGVKEREREEANARQLIAAAETSRLAYEEARQNLTAAIEDRDELRARLGAKASQEERMKLWDADDAVEDRRVEVERHFGETVRLLSQSLGHTSTNSAHDALASLYWERFTDAEQRGDRAMAAYFENLVVQHDTGAFSQRLRGLARLEVETASPATITLSRVHERHRRLIADETVAVGDSRLEVERIAHGRYQLDLTAEGYAPIQMPVFLEREARRELHLKMWPRETIPEDFVLIPEGEFRTGPPHEAGAEPRRAREQTFAIKRTPVTCAEYVEFLNALAAYDLDEAMKHTPRLQDDNPSYFPLVDGRFVVPQEDADGDAWDPDWPICIVNYYDALAYVGWRSQRDGRQYSLPTSAQWEKAARGIDGRLYPWGNHFDPSFCRMRDSKPGQPVPAPVSSYEVDSSPYGVTDMAGNICEWTATRQPGTENSYLLRGGSFNSIALMCRLDWQMHSPATFRNAHYGFRLVLNLS